MKTNKNQLSGRKETTSIRKGQTTMKAALQSSLNSMIIVGLLLVATWGVRADVIVRNGLQGSANTLEWQTITAWYNPSISGAEVPKVDDEAQLQYARYTYMTTINTVGELQMYSAGGAPLEIRSGGSLTVTNTGGRTGEIVLSGAGSTTVPGYPEWNAHRGVVNIETGGSLISGNTGARVVITGDASQFGELNLNGGTFTAQGTTGADTLTIRNAQINLNSGTFDMTGGQIFLGNGGAVEFNIYGDGTTILMDNLNSSNPLAGGVFNFIMDSDGVSTFIDAGTTNLKNIEIVVDGSNYTGNGLQQFTLFSAANLASLPDIAPQAINFGGANYWFEQVGNDYIFFVPEPSTGILLAMAGLAFLRRRHRG